MKNTPTQMRFTADELAMLDRIKTECGLSSRTEAARYAIRQAAKQLKIKLEKSSANQGVPLS